MAIKLYVGCGDDRREGFLHVDVRAISGVDIVSAAWEVSRHVSGVDEIYSRHMLEHLTDKEALCSLQDWYQVLKSGGSVYIVVPNLDYHIEQWLRAEWTDKTYENQSESSHAFAGFYGWQRQCDPSTTDYDKSYWDVHKSGYNEARLSYLLNRVGFVDIKTEIKSKVHLVASAKKQN